MGFPVAGDEIYRNDDGEVVGWSKPADAGTYWCDDCGFSHGGPCPPEPDEDPDELGIEQEAWYEAEMARGELAFAPTTMRCFECRGFDGINFETQEVVALGPIAEAYRDPTRTYILKCGHTVI